VLAVRRDRPQELIDEVVVRAFHTRNPELGH
jgi:hypothetical protein